MEEVGKLGDEKIIDLKKEFDEKGFVVLERLIDAEIVLGLSQELRRLLDQHAEEKKNESRSVFDTENQTQATDQAFLDSGDGVQYFYEKEAPTEVKDLDRALVINKIGHALHADGGVVQAFTCQPLFGQLVKEVAGIPEPAAVQSMFILKPPRIGGRVDIHQDSSFLFTTPETCTGVWIPLQDAHMENGCLWAIPGSHRESLYTRFVRKDGASSVVFEPPAPPVESYDSRMHEFVPLEVPAGSVVLIHGRLLHMSKPNRSSDSRHVYTFHCIGASAEWAPDNWMIRRVLTPLKM